MYQFKPRIDWFTVQRRLGQSPHLRLVVGWHAGKSALIRVSTGSVLATNPKQALETISDLRASAMARAA